MVVRTTTSPARPVPAATPAPAPAQTQTTTGTQGTPASTDAAATGQAATTSQTTAAPVADAYQKAQQPSSALGAQRTPTQPQMAPSGRAISRSDLAAQLNAPRPPPPVTAATTAAPTGETATTQGVDPAVQDRWAVRDSPASPPVDWSASPSLAKADKALAEDPPSNAVFSAFGAKFPDGKNVAESFGVSSAEIRTFIDTGKMSPALARMHDAATHTPSKMWGDPMLEHQRARNAFLGLATARDAALGNKVKTLDGQIKALEGKSPQSPGDATQLSELKAERSGCAADKTALYERSRLPLLNAMKKTQTAWTAQVKTEAASNAKKAGAATPEGDVAANKANVQYAALATTERVQGHNVAAAEYEVSRGNVSVAHAAAEGNPLHPSEVQGFVAAEKDLANVPVQQTRSASFQHAAADLDLGRANAADARLEGNGLSLTGGDNKAAMAKLSDSGAAEAGDLATKALAWRQSGVGHIKKEIAALPQSEMPRRLAAQARLATEEKTLATQAPAYQGIARLADARAEKVDGKRFGLTNSKTPLAKPDTTGNVALNVAEYEVEQKVKSGELDKKGADKLLDDLKNDPKLKGLSEDQKASVLMSVANYPASLDAVSRFIRTPSFQEPRQSLGGDNKTAVTDPKDKLAAQQMMLRTVGMMSEDLATEKTASEPWKKMQRQGPMGGIGKEWQSDREHALGYMVDSIADGTQPIVWMRTGEHENAAGMVDSSGDMHLNFSGVGVKAGMNRYKADGSDPFALAEEKKAENSNYREMLDFVGHEFNHQTRAASPTGRNIDYFRDETQAYVQGYRLAHGKEPSKAEIGERIRDRVLSYEDFKNAKSGPNEYQGIPLSKAAESTLPEEDQALARQIREDLAGMYDVPPEAISNDGQVDSAYMEKHPKAPDGSSWNSFLNKPYNTRSDAMAGFDSDNDPTTMAIGDSPEGTLRAPGAGGGRVKINNQD